MSLKYARKPNYTKYALKLNIMCKRERICVQHHRSSKCRIVKDLSLHRWCWAMSNEHPVIQYSNNNSVQCKMYSSAYCNSFACSDNAWKHTINQRFVTTYLIADGAITEISKISQNCLFRSASPCAYNMYVYSGRMWYD